jgi:hypothetical protein
MRSVRGPSSYSAGGFLVTLGDTERIGSSSGRMVAAWTVSSSPLQAQVVGASGNVATVILRDLRSSGIEPTAGDFSATHIGLVYEGV